MASLVPTAPATTVALSLVIREQNNQLSSALARCREKLKAKRVHELRTAARKLRAALELAAAFEKPAALACARDLKRLMKALSPLRDVQVQLKTLEGLSESWGHASRLSAQLQREKRAIKRKARRRLAAFDSQELERSVAEVAHGLESRPASGQATGLTAAVVIGELAARHLRVLRERAGVSEHDPRSLHELRLALKSYRDGFSAVRSSLSVDAQRAADSLLQLQDELGRAHDAHVLAKAARRAHGPQLEQLASALEDASSAAQRSAVELARRANIEFPFSSDGSGP